MANGLELQWLGAAQQAGQQPQGGGGSGPDNRALPPQATTDNPNLKALMDGRQAVGTAGRPPGSNGAGPEGGA